jgi:multiple antibiotic resistance protein
VRLWTTLFLAFTALIPLINPLGSALVFLGLVGSAPTRVYKALAKRIAINNIIFLSVIELVGSPMLKFFGISLPIVQVSGGFVIIGLAWSMLNQKDSSIHNNRQAELSEVAPAAGDLVEFEDRAFYPFTFPITSGPGTLVTTLTLSAHAADNNVTSDLVAHIGLFVAIVAVSALVYVCYAYAPRLANTLSPSTVNGVVRVMAFVVLCIGTQIAWNGITSLLTGK